MNNSRGSCVAIIDYFEYFRAVNRPSRPHYHGYMNKEEYKQANIDFLCAKAAEEGVVKLQGGVLVEVLSSGVGTKCPVLGSVVMTRYRGTLIDGREFDRSDDTSPIIEPFRVRDVIAGWQVALIRMHKGDKWRVYIPATYAYGNKRVDNIPANSTLIFDIELVDFQ